MANKREGSVTVFNTKLVLKNQDEACQLPADANVYVKEINPVSGNRAAHSRTDNKKAVLTTCGFYKVRRRVVSIRYAIHND